MENRHKKGKGSWNEGKKKGRKEIRKERKKE